MTQLPTLALRKEELSRRVGALTSELAAWKTRSTNQLDMDVHFSQLQALATLVDALVAGQREIAKSLDPEGEPGKFQEAGFQLIMEIIRGQRIWDFFRSKLELRFSPDFHDSLWVADTIAWDCYRPVMDRAVDAGIVPAAQVREPPLTYLTADFSPATWVRGSRPFDGRDYALGTSTLPIPVIEVPWDHIGNLWELVSLQHEVGHDLEADLKLRQELLLSLGSALKQAGVPDERIKVWQSWEAEIFADLIGLQLGGPAFAEGLMHILLLPPTMALKYDPNDPHPTHYLRVLMAAAYVRTLVPGRPVLGDDAAAIETNWKGLYGSPAVLDEFIADFPVVFRGLMDSPMKALKNQPVRALVPYTAADDARIRDTAAFLRTGMNAPAQGTVAPRHCVSAARLAAATAVTDAKLNPALDISALLGDINTSLIKLVRDSAAPGLRGGDTSDPHKRFIASFAELTLERS